jgi:flagellin
MALTLNSNLASLRAANTLNGTQGALSHTLARISSGLRVVTAADDAAGAAVAANLQTQARSGRQAIRNSNDGLSVIQTAEAATSEVVNILDRMRELAVQSASETLASGERGYINDEFDDLSNEIQRIAKATEFNDIALADGTNTTLTVQVGVDGGTESEVAITLGDLTSSTLGVGTGDVDLTTATGAQTALTTIDTALDSVNDIRAEYGSSSNRLGSAIGNMTSYVEALTSAASQIMDADYAHETAEMTRLQVMQQAGVAALAQARTMNQSVISLLG